MLSRTVQVQFCFASPGRFGRMWRWRTALPTCLRGACEFSVTILCSAIRARAGPEIKEPIPQAPALDTGGDVESYCPSEILFCFAWAYWEDVEVVKSLGDVSPRPGIPFSRSFAQSGADQGLKSRRSRERSTAKDCQDEKNRRLGDVIEVIPSMSASTSFVLQDSQSQEMMCPCPCRQVLLRGGGRGGKPVPRT